MTRLWREHQLLLILLTMLLVTLALGTWATYFEYVHNEQGFPEGHHAFWTDDFLAYWSMSLLMNYAPELMGTITIILLAAKFSEKFGVK